MATLAVPFLPFGGRQLEVINQLVLLLLAVMKPFQLRLVVLRFGDDHVRVVSLGVPVKPKRKAFGNLTRIVIA